MAKFRNLVGQKFGRLTVIDRAENARCGRTMWRCKCECGNEIVAFGLNISRGATKSCGCLYEERAHRLSHTRLHRIWTGMKTRCTNPKHHEFHNYGGRGITVCDEWKNDFQSFYDWAISNGYADDLTIDRVDNNRGYSPENCRWITNNEQQNNRNCNRMITYNGKTQTLTKWADELGIKRVTLQARITRYNWNVDRALSTK